MTLERMSPIGIFTIAVILLLFLIQLTLQPTTTYADPPKKIEYKFVRLEHAGVEEAFLDLMSFRLSKYGNDGWELVSFVSLGSSYWMAILKR